MNFRINISIYFERFIHMLMDNTTTKELLTLLEVMQIQGDIICPQTITNRWFIRS
jgi:hypothetical protein